MLKTATLATTVALATLAFANAAEAALITLNGTDYEVSTVVGTYNDLSSTLEMTPWFGDEALTTSAAIQVGDAFGIFDNTGTGPLFAKGISSIVDIILEGATFNGSTTQFSIFLIGTPDLATYAIATEVQPIPEPLTILGAGAAIAFGAAFKRKLGKVKQN